MKIIYIHGWQSSANSNTINELKNALKDHTVIALDIKTSPEKAMQQIATMCDVFKPDYIIGTSLGGLYVNCLYDFKFKNIKKILINPAFVIPDIIKPGVHKFHNKRQNNQTEFTFTEDDYNYLKYLQKTKFNGSTSQKNNTTIILGKQDELFNVQSLCLSYFNNDNVILKDFGHRLTKEIINDTLIDLIK